MWHRAIASRAKVMVAAADGCPADRHELTSRRRPTISQRRPTVASIQIAIAAAA
jgi:hypothetical protein